MVCPNPTICRLMDVDTYEAYKELLNKSARSRQAKSFTEVLSLLYTGEINTFAGFAMSPEKVASKLAGLFAGKIGLSPQSKMSSPSILQGMSSNVNL